MNRFLTNMASFIIEQGLNVFSIATIERDSTLAEMQVQTANACQNSYSVAKAFCVTAVGMLYDRGLLSTDDLVCDILKDELPEGMDERWRTATVDMALSHQLGLPGGFLDIDCPGVEAFGTDYLRYMFLAPLICAPGETRCYTDGAYYLISRIVEKVSGEPLDNFLWHELFTPLGFREIAWSHCPMGHPMGATGLYIRTGDMVKLGAVYLNGGEWKGHRFLSEKWVDIVLTRGYELRIIDEKTGAYGKGGMHGQKLMVLPQKRRVVAYHGNGNGLGDILEDWLIHHQD